MEAIKWAFEVYQRNLVRVVLPIIALETVVLFAAGVVPRVLGSLLRVALQDPRSAIAAAVQYTTGAVLGIVSVAYAVTCVYPYLLDLARGRVVELADAFRPRTNLVNALVLVTVVSVATSLGLSLCVLPGLALISLFSPAFPAAADRDLDAVSTIRECMDHGQRHFLPILFFGLLSVAITAAGAALCGVGAVFVSVPLVMTAQIYVYLRLHGEAPVGAD